MCAGALRREARGHSEGYVRIFRPDHALANGDGYVLEHRLVVHDAGIVVPPGSHVHHRNGDKRDNRLENLEVLDASAHIREHALERGDVTNQHGTFPLHLGHRG